MRLAVRCCLVMAFATAIGLGAPKHAFGQG